MSGIKTHLRRVLTNSKKDLEEAIDRNKKATDALEQFKGRNATYKVKLFSLWKDHDGEDTAVTYTGNLRDAINAGEEEHQRINGGLQANYHVAVQVGPIWLDVPEKFWTRYKRKNS